MIMSRPTHVAASGIIWFFFIAEYHFIVYIYTTGEGNGTPLQYSCLENLMDGGDC